MFDRVARVGNPREVPRTPSHAARRRLHRRQRAGTVDAARHRDAPDPRPWISRRRQTQRRPRVRRRRSLGDSNTRRRRAASHLVGVPAELARRVAGKSAIDATAPVADLVARRFSRAARARAMAAARGAAALRDGVRAATACTSPTSSRSGSWRELGANRFCSARRASSRGQSHYKRSTAPAECPHSSQTSSFFSESTRRRSPWCSDGATRARFHCFSNDASHVGRSGSEVNRWTGGPVDR